MRRRIATRAREETGVAMAVVIIALAAIGVLSAAAVTVALQTHTSSRRDANSINALEAAEAGLQVATYRLNMLRPSDSNCVGDVVSAPTSGYCTSSVTTLGNGSTYQYFMTPTISNSATCVGLALVSTSYLSQRCITAVGTSHGVTQRAQIRAAAFGAIPLFPVPGITGLGGITNFANSSANGYEASNRSITSQNGVSILGTVQLGPGGSYTPGQNNIGPTATVHVSQPLVLAPVSPGTSNQPLSGGSCGSPPNGEPSFSGLWCNDDYRISNFLNNPSHPSTPYDQSAGGVTFNASARTLTMQNNSSLTLTGGVYNFCAFTAVNQATIILAPGVKTEIIIDSPDDPGSGCTTASGGTGTFYGKNGITWINPTGDPTALQIYVYGRNDLSNVVEFKNNSTFYGVLYAPLSQVNLYNNAVFNGAVSGNNVNLENNFQFNWDSRSGGLQAQTTGIYYRTAWAKCTPTATSSDAGSGCG
jgi:Tfp pilus assembly protein PilX